MYERLDDLFYNFYGDIDSEKAKRNIEEFKKELSEKLSEEDRKILEELLSKIKRINNLKIKDSFIQGLKLGFEITKEVKEYDYNDIEKEIND